MAEKKLAYRRVVKNEDNEIRLMYVDTATGQPIHPDNIGEYTLLDQGTAGVTGDLDLEGKDKKTEAEKIADPLKKIPDNSSDGGEGFNYNFAGSMPRNPSNNYGFIDKNIAVKALGKLGIPGKALNLAINGNNIEATNAARETLGLGPMSTKEAISSLVAGRDGYVADVKIGDEQYSVGLKAMDRAGRTTLTPMEARNRSLHTGFGLKEATPAERKQSIADAKANPDIQKSRGGVLGEIGRAAVGAVTGGLGGAAASVLSNVDFRGPQGTYQEPVSRQTVSRVPAPAAPAGPSPAFGAAGARGMQGFDVGPGGMANVASPAFGARGARGMQGYSIPGGPSPAFGARGASGMQMREDIPTPTARPSRSRGLMDVADVRGAPVAGGGVTRPSLTGKQPYSPREIETMTRNDPMGFRAPLQSVDWDRTNLHPAAKARMKQYTDLAEKRGVNAYVDMKSMVRTPEQQKDILKAGASKTNTSYHMSGMAVDISPLDDKNWKEWQDIRAVGQDLGFGQLDPKWDPAHLQLSGHGLNARQLASLPRDEFGRPMLTPQQELAFRQSAVPTPTARPDPAVVSAEQQLQGTPAAGSFRAAQEEGLQGFAEQAREELVAPEGKMTQDAVERAQQRVDTRPAEVREAMAFTIAGELGSQTLANIASGDPEKMSQARQEIAAIASTIDNRAHSTRYANSQNPYGDVLSPSQYNSLMAGNLPTTEANYDQFGDFITQALVDYDYGVNPSPVPDATHYAANYINPSWETSAIGGMTPVGEHKFGTIAMAGTDIAEYRPSGSGFGRIAGGGESSIGLTRTTDASSFGSGFSSGFDRESGDSYGGFSTSRSSNYGSSSARSGQSRAGVSSENRSGGYDVGRSGESSFGGFSAGSLGGSASGRGSGYGSTGSGGYSSFSRDNESSGGSYGAGSQGWSGGGYSGGSSGGRSSGPSSSSPAGGSQAAGGWSGGGRSSSSSGGSYSGGSAKDSGEHSSGSGGFGGTNV